MMEICFWPLIQTLPAFLDEILVYQDAQQVLITDFLDEFSGTRADSFKFQDEAFTLPAMRAYEVWR